MEPASSASTASEGEGSVYGADILLAQAVLRKDRKATAEFVQRFTSPVYTYVRNRLLPRADLVDDVVHDVFLAAWASLANYRGGAPLEAWLLGIARHKVESYYRSRLRDSEGLSADGDETIDTRWPALDESLDREQMEERTRQVLAELPEPYALALLWRYWERSACAKWRPVRARRRRRWSV